jgi:hypothetical protein
MDSLYASQCTTSFLLFYCVPFELRDSTRSREEKTPIFHLNFCLIITQDTALIRGIAAHVLYVLPFLVLIITLTIP